MAAPDPIPLDEARTRRSLVTPEGVDLNLRIADAGQRIGAFLLDVIFQNLILAGFSLACFFLVAALGLKRLEYVAVIWLLGAFLLRNAWFIGFELSPRAATPGKRIMGIRVASRDGGRLTAEAIIVRNAVREVEIFLPITAIVATSASGGGVETMLYLLMAIWTGIFLFFPLFNRDRLRAGDLIAGTWVVRAPRRTLLPDLADSDARSRFTFTDKHLQAYGVKELHVLEQVLRSRDRKTMAAVAQRIRRKIDWEAPLNEGDEEFLAAYYAGLRSRLEQRLLFGHRRKDKFDTA
jgi:uncharacterized RDD family membrane protein YckC